ncbi:MAG: hypothetical protein ACI93L_001675 [Cyclobacteriaceae bacterium]|jgi:hypothetical protein
MISPIACLLDKSGLNRILMVIVKPRINHFIGFQFDGVIVLNEELKMYQILVLARLNYWS